MFRQEFCFFLPRHVLATRSHSSQMPLAAVCQSNLSADVWEVRPTWQVTPPALCRPLREAFPGVRTCKVPWPKNYGGGAIPKRTVQRFFGRGSPHAFSHLERHCGEANRQWVAWLNRSATPLYRQLVKSHVRQQETLPRKVVSFKVEQMFICKRKLKLTDKNWMNTFELLIIAQCEIITTKSWVRPLGWLNQAILGKDDKDGRGINAWASHHTPVRNKSG